MFNLLAFSQGAEFVLQEKFDSIRNWIVNGGENKFARFADDLTSVQLITKTEFIKAFAEV